jgi:lysophospholipase L1-like esterase
MSVASPAGSPAALAVRAQRRRARPLWFKVAILAFSYLLLEAGSALVYKLALTDPERAAIYARRADSFATTVQIPHPYTLIALNPRGIAYGRPQMNRLGFRSPETTVARPPGTARIVCLGGSTTYGTSVERPDQAYPAQMQEYLRRQLGRDGVEVLNGGISYGCSFEILSTFLYRVLPLDPDIVVVDCSINDIEPLLLPDYAEDYTHWRQNWAAPTIAPWLRVALHSPFVSVLYAKVARPHARAISYQKQKVDVLNIETLPLTPEIRARKATAYRRNIENLLLVARGRGIRVLLVTPKARFERPHFAWVFAQHRAILAELSRRYDAPLCDFYSRFRLADEHWVDIRGNPDPVHLDAYGERLKGELVGADLLTHFGDVLRDQGPTNAE